MPTTLTVAPYVTASVHEDGLMLLHARQGALFASNRAGALIWKALEQHVSLDAIAATLGDTCGIAHELARADTLRFIEELQRLGLIEGSATP